LDAWFGNAQHAASLVVSVGVPAGRSVGDGQAGMEPAGRGRRTAAGRAQRGVSRGAAIETERFERVDYDRFTERLVHSLAALAVVTEIGRADQRFS
jgi:hypothetical protein